MSDIQDIGAALLNLAECCEEAAGPDIELDREIYFQAFCRPIPEGYRWAGYAVDGRFTWMDADGTPLVASYVARPYTASLDAAMTLVQPNWWVNVSGPMSPAAYGYSREDQRRPRAGVEMIGHPYSAGAHAATHALALTAACLRALASVDRSGEAGETRSEAKGLDPKDESAVGAAETPNLPHSGDPQ